MRVSEKRNEIMYVRQYPGSKNENIFIFIVWVFIIVCFGLLTFMDCSTHVYHMDGMDLITLVHGDGLSGLGKSRHMCKKYKTEWKQK